ncbi:hypothetical protein PR002_g20550 [Phytophthora rubi]|uniref:Uncharacterized protein n=1 Tax=Phytophthora rubi TaxID=129364 RepID=A0A6A3JK12_9STRA|nr:hypothetical protein PR002_g20550 [Phytophthora rubi]
MMPSQARGTLVEELRVRLCRCHCEDRVVSIETWTLLFVEEPDRYFGNVRDDSTANVRARCRRHDGGNKRQGGRQEHDRDSGVWQDSKNDRYNGGLKHGDFMVSWGLVTEPTMPYVDSSKLDRYEHFILYWIL